MAARGLWIYAVAERVDAAGLRQLTGVGGGPVRVTSAAGLAAVAEDVGLAEFGEDALRRNLEDMAWLETTARAHHQVIDAVAQQGPLVPMRLATVYRSEASLAAVLADRAADFRAALDRISGRREWGVKVYPAQQSEPGSAAAREGRPTGPGAGAAYLQRRRDELAAQRSTRREAAASAEMVHAELSRRAVAAGLHPPQAAELTGSKTPMILNAAYLLDDESGADFAAAVTDLAERHPGVRLELTGPWPPYSFAGLREVENLRGLTVRRGTSEGTHGGHPAAASPGAPASRPR
jgi:Gas vesicle synthesis protein GvpL/GvpF